MTISGASLSQLRGGGGARVPVRVTGSPFASLAALETWSQANPSELLNNADNFATAVITSDGAYSWGGVDQTYTSGQWSRDESLTTAQVEALDTLTSGTAGAVPMFTSGGVADSPLTVQTDRVTSSRSFAPPSSDGVILGNLDVFNGGATLGARELAEDRTFYAGIYELTDQGSSRLSREAYTVVADTPAAADTSETFTGQQHQFALVNLRRGNADQYGFMIPPGAPAVTDCNIIIRYNSHADPVDVFNYQESTGGEGFDFPAGNALPSTDFVAAPIPLPRPAFFPEQQAIYVTITAGQGQSLTLAGQTFNTGTAAGDQPLPAIVVTGQPSERRFIADVQDVVDAVNNGSHQGITAVGRITQDGDPVIDLSLTTPQQQAMITAFSIQGQAPHVAAGTSLSGSQMFLYTVTNPGLVTGLGTLTQGASAISTQVDPAGNAIDQVIQAVTLNAGEAVVFTLAFDLTAGGTISRTFMVQARAQAETLYYGVMSANDAAGVDVSTLSSERVVVNSQFDADFVTPNTHYYVILSPADRELTAITERTFNAPILTSFTKTENVRTIGGQSYDAYVRQNNSGAEGTLATQITVG